MKTGNLLSAILISSLFAGALACDLLLAAQYRNTDLADPYKNFETISVSQFKYISISGGNGYAIQLKAGRHFSVKLMKSRKSFFALKQSGSSLAVCFKVANQTYQRPEDCTVGLIITAPDISRLKLSGVNTVVSGFRSDSMRMELDSSAQLRCSSLNIENLFVQATRGASVDFQQLNRAGLLSLELRGHASATFHQMVYNRFAPIVSDSASIRLYGNSLEQLRAPVIH
jgi:hypothetical protein